MGIRWGFGGPIPFPRPVRLNEDYAAQARAEPEFTASGRTGPPAVGAASAAGRFQPFADPPLVRSNSTLMQREGVALRQLQVQRSALEWVSNLAKAASRPSKFFALRKCFRAYVDRAPFSACPSSNGMGAAKSSGEIRMLWHSRSKTCSTAPRWPVMKPSPACPRRSRPTACDVPGTIITCRPAKRPIIIRWI